MNTLSVVENIVKMAPGGYIPSRGHLYNIAYLLTAAEKIDDYLKPFKLLEHSVCSSQLLNLFYFRKKPGTLINDVKQVSGCRNRYTYHAENPFKPADDLVTFLVNADGDDLRLISAAVFLHYEGEDKPWKMARKRIGFSKKIMRRSMKTYDKLRAVGSTETSFPIIKG